MRSERGESSIGRPAGGRLSPSDIVAALRGLRDAGIDDSARALELGSVVGGSLTAVLSALRWAAVLIGFGWIVSMSNAGNVAVVAGFSVVIFLTMWRTISPIRPGDRTQSQQALALTDVAVLSAALGLHEGLSNPMVGAVIVAVAIASFGWGVRLGSWAAAIAIVVSTSVDSLMALGFDAPSPAGVMAVLGACIFPGIAQQRLLQLEDRRRVTTEQVSSLEATNALLDALHHLALSMPSSLDLADVLLAARTQLVDAFGADRVVVLAYDDTVWSPLHQTGFSIQPSLDEADLPEPFPSALASTKALHIGDLRRSGIERGGSGLYTRLVVDGRDTGLLGIEGALPDQFSSADAELFDGMAHVLALTIANARAFQHLRALAAADERSRIARDLHDRLGQWLTYIGLELERINTAAAEPSTELKQLHGDVQGAISELRDTLVELRAAVNVDRPLSIVLAEVVDRFTKRSDIEVSLSVPESRSQHLAPIVENELLRIAQEALTNVEKHAKATHVHVGWSIENGRGVLIIQDNGRGFLPSQGIRGTAYGLVGMRERAASVGAILEITSEPDHGTVITVLTSSPT